MVRTFPRRYIIAGCSAGDDGLFLEQIRTGRGGCRCSDGGGELVPTAGQRGDVGVGAGELVERLAQGGDALGEIVLVDEGIGPDSFE